MITEIIKVARISDGYMYDDTGRKVAVYSERQCKWFALTWVQKYCERTSARIIGLQEAKDIVTKVALTDAAWHDLQTFEPVVYTCIKPPFKG